MVVAAPEPDEEEKQFRASLLLKKLELLKSRLVQVSPSVAAPPPPVYVPPPPPAVKKPRPPPKPKGKPLMPAARTCWLLPPACELITILALRAATPKPKAPKTPKTPVTPAAPIAVAGAASAPIAVDDVEMAAAAPAGAAPVAPVAGAAAAPAPSPVTTSRTNRVVKTPKKAGSSEPKAPPVRLSAALRKCRDVLKSLMARPQAPIFNSPVDPVRLNIPDYPTIIK